MPSKSKPQNYNIIGAGLAGLATAYSLKQASPDANITLYDQKGIGAGASGIASGLLHPYPGPTHRPAAFAYKALHEALKLIHFSKTPIKQTIIRRPKNQTEHVNLAKLSQKYPNLSWSPPNLTIQNAYTLDTPTYLHNLYTALNVPLIIDTIAHPEKLPGITILTTGASTKDPTLQIIKGQRIDIAPQPHTIIQHGYLTTHHFGATYEHKYNNSDPDPTTADALLRPKWHAMNLGTYKPLRYLAGLRCTQKGTTLPLIKKLTPSLYLYTALGSRGLLHHAHFAHTLIQHHLKINCPK